MYSNLCYDASLLIRELETMGSLPVFMSTQTLALYNVHHFAFVAHVRAVLFRCTRHVLNEMLLVTESS